MRSGGGGLATDPTIAVYTHISTMCINKPWFRVPVLGNNQHSAIFVDMRVEVQLANYWIERGAHHICRYVGALNAKVITE